MKHLLKEWTLFAGFALVFSFLVFLSGPRTQPLRKSSKMRIAWPAMRPDADHDQRQWRNGKSHVDETKFKHSVHGRMFTCVDCHTDVKSLAHETPPAKVSCAQCHADAL